MIGERGIESVKKKEKRNFFFKNKVGYDKQKIVYFLSNILIRTVWCGNIVLKNFEYVQISKHVFYFILYIKNNKYCIFFFTLIIKPKAMYFIIIAWKKKIL